MDIRPTLIKPLRIEAAIRGISEKELVNKFIEDGLSDKVKELINKEENLQKPNSHTSRKRT